MPFSVSYSRSGTSIAPGRWLGMPIWSNQRANLISFLQVNGSVLDGINRHNNVDAWFDPPPRDGQGANRFSPRTSRNAPTWVEKGLGGALRSNAEVRGPRAASTPSGHATVLPGGPLSMAGLGRRWATKPGHAAFDSGHVLLPEFPIRANFGPEPLMLTEWWVAILEPPFPGFAP